MEKTKISFLSQAAREVALACPVPAETMTYKPVAHGFVIDSLKERLDKAGLVLADERYTVARHGQQMFGAFTVKGTNEEQDFSIGFRNSYDKSMQLGIVTGSRVVVCSNMMFKGDHVVQKMHTKSGLIELDQMGDEAIAKMSETYAQLQRDSKKMKRKRIKTVDAIEDLIRRLRDEERLLSATQEHVLRREIELQERFAAETVWDFYNHTTEALKLTPAVDVVDRYSRAHELFLAMAA